MSRKQNCDVSGVSGPGGACSYSTITSEGCRITLTTLQAGSGLVMTLTGGDEPHIGAVAIGVPRASLQDPDRISATVSVYAMVGHKDDELAKPIAEQAARRLNRVVVVSAGIHIADASSGHIQEIIEAARELAQESLLCLESE